MSVAKCLLRHALIAVADIRSLAPWLQGVARSDSWRARFLALSTGILDTSKVCEGLVGVSDRKIEQKPDALQASSVSDRKRWSWSLFFGNNDSYRHVVTRQRLVTRAIRHVGATMKVTGFGHGDVNEGPVDPG